MLYEQERDYKAYRGSDRTGPDMYIRSDPYIRPYWICALDWIGWSYWSVIHTVNRWWIGMGKQVRSMGYDNIWTSRHVTSVPLKYRAVLGKGAQHTSWGQSPLDPITREYDLDSRWWWWWWFTSRNQREKGFYRYKWQIQITCSLNYI
jgi:hypothetical protein